MDYVNLKLNERRRVVCNQILLKTDSFLCVDFYSKFFVYFYRVGFKLIVYNYTEPRLYRSKLLSPDMVDRLTSKIVNMIHVKKCNCNL